VDVQRYRQFRSEERVKVFPKSGHCNWYCVPEYMEYGNKMVVENFGSLAAPAASQAYILKPTPNTCDLYDIYKNITAGLGPMTAASTSYGGDTSQNPDALPAIGSEAIIPRRIRMPFGTQHTAGSLNSQIPGALRVVKPGMDYTIKTHITYDNVSSLDAFVEVYKLTYKPPAPSSYAGNVYQLGMDYHVSELHRFNMFPRMFVSWVGTTAVHPGAEFCPVSSLADPQQRSAGAYFGSSLLKAYCDAAIYQRTHPFSTSVTGYTGGDSGTVGGDFQTTQGFYETQHLQPAAEGGTAGTNASGRGSMNNPVLRKMIVCHPKIDPTNVTPKSRPTSQLGFTLERVQGPRRVKPGGHASFQLPNKGVRHWEFAKSPLGREPQDSTTAEVGAKPTLAGYAVVYCFRVWGDMIHGKTPLADGFETDFQSGSTAVTFQTLRTVWARVRPKVNTVVNPTLLPFDADVAFGDQEQINEESDRPELIMHAGDGVANA